MKVFVYGTLMRAYGNNRLLSQAEFLGEGAVKDYKLFFSAGGYGGFPVSRPSDGDTIKGELWEIAPEDNSTLRNLDSLESEGYMYNRTPVQVQTDDGEVDAMMYVGTDRMWSGDYNLTHECPKNENNEFYWTR